MNYIPPGVQGTFTLIWPEQRVVSVDWVLSQGLDAKINAAIAAHEREHGPLTDAEFSPFMANVAAPDVAQSIALLSDLGLATFARESAAGWQTWDALTGADDDEGDR